MIGRTLAQYEVLEKLGEGGMGVVYKARDTHLDRFVALKVLPPEKVADPDRKRRFVQEARTASALNHPNIVTIHDISQSGGLTFIAMECVEGKTLDDLIGHKGLKLNLALKYAIQIAGALAKAHAAGIVHRDLKPSNIMVTADGVVKVLDFGLAKLTEAHPPSEDESTRTVEGHIAGTVAYMSPEQAEGKPVDARSDIFAFGAVLYEMVTGRRVFARDSAASTLAAVIKEQPKPPGEVTPGVPRDLEKLILRCLHKDPERRWQTMGDLPVLLRELVEESESQPGAAPASVKKARRRWIYAALAALPLAAAGGWVLWPRGGGVAPPRVVQLTSLPGITQYPCFSPDGSQVAFTWNGEKGDNLDVYVKLVGETNVLRLTSDPARDEWPTWSPDGKRIAVQRSAPERATAVYLISPLGGAERKLADFPATGQMSWSPDGKWLAVGREQDGIFLLPAEGGSPRRLSAPPKAPRYNIHAVFSPDGRRLAYAACAAAFSCDLHVQELGTDYTRRGSPHRIREEGAYTLGLAWRRDGESIIYSGGLPSASLWVSRIRGNQPRERLELAGLRAAHPAVAPAGNRLAFARSQLNPDIWRFQPGAPPAPLIRSTLGDTNPQFSPDGNRIAFGSARSGEAYDLWVANADGSAPAQLTDRLGLHQGTPRWSPDGRWIVFDSQSREGHWDIWVVEAAGGQPRRITPEPSDEVIPSWSRDGKWVYFLSDRGGAGDIWRAPVFDRGQAEQVTSNGGYTAFESADGKTLYYTKDETSPLFAKALGGGAERQVLDGVVMRAFVPVEEGIYYLGRPEDGRYPLRFFEFSSRANRVLTTIEGPLGLGLSVSPDRKTFLFTKSASAGSDLMLIENFR